jgi:hypothetical protein
MAHRWVLDVLFLAVYLATLVPYDARHWRRTRRRRDLHDVHAYLLDGSADLRSCRNITLEVRFSRISDFGHWAVRGPFSIL